MADFAFEPSQHMSVYDLVRPGFFLLDPEQAHHLAFKGLDQAHRLKILPLIVGSVPKRPVQFCGLDLPNPVGLAAGLDKDGKYIDALASLGFGFLEIGTVTPLAQSGNPKPRMFRLADSMGIINRMGFNNDGVDACVARVKASAFYQSGGVIGLNIGKNATTPIEQAANDYVTCLRKVYAVASYITINISSPNTKNLRQLQSGNDLVELLQDLDSARQELIQKHGVRKPLFLKIAPDLDSAAIRQICNALLEFKIDALIATNTTLTRDGVEQEQHRNQIGGLSGKPLKHLSTQTIKSFAHLLQGQVPIIGVGGIMTGSDALEKFHAGASVIQLYSGLIYKGPQLIKDAIQALDLP
jgi:dihydroorotate dehydrogenase